MKFLYLSILVSPEALRDAEKKDCNFSAYAVQKFHHLLTQGLVKNGVKVNALSTFYLPRVGWGYYRHSEYCDGVSFDYIPTVNISVLRHLWLTVYCFVRVFLFGLYNRHEKVLCCDVLNISACMGAVVAAKLVGLRRVGIVTDMPDFVMGGNRFAARLNRKIISGFTHYVFLTEQMNSVLNVKSRPYIVMEGLVDSSFDVKEKRESDSRRILLYAGGLYEKYGLRLLIDGFINANVTNSELHLYGDGSFVDSIKEYSSHYPNVRYRGIQPNDIIVEKEREATLLVNPRPTNEEFTQYSFPSKNMEYMLSGTPLLTTKLPGMPKEYYPYVFLLEEESKEEYARKIHDILSMPADGLKTKGQVAQHWVIERKNNKVQAQKIVDLVK